MGISKKGLNLTGSGASMKFVYKLLVGEVFYIGGTENIEQRLQYHLYLLENNKHHNIRLQEEFNIKLSFDFEIVSEHKDKTALDIAETSCIMSYEEDVNCCNILKGQTWTKDCNPSNMYSAWGSAEHLRKISEKLKGRKIPKDVREKISASLKGRKISQEALDKHNYRMNNDNPMKGKKHKASSKEKMSAAKKGGNSPHAVGVMVLGVYYVTITAAAISLGIKVNTLGYRLGSPNFPEYERVSND